jgi:hypothetical protein
LAAAPETDMTETKPKRRWFRFSIRDLLLSTVIAALTIGWWLDHRNLTRESSPVLTVYHVRHVDPKTISASLWKIYSGNPGVQISVDPRTSIIIAKAPARQQREVAAILTELDVPIATQ